MKPKRPRKLGVPTATTAVWPSAANPLERGPHQEAAQPTPFVSRIHGDGPKQERRSRLADPYWPVADRAEDAPLGEGDEAEVAHWRGAFTQAVGRAGQAIGAERAVQQGLDLRAVLRPLDANGRHVSSALDDGRRRW